MRGQIVGLLLAALVGCGLDDSDPAASRVPVTIVDASPEGVAERTAPIEFVFSAPITDPPVSGLRVAISPPIPVELRWTAPDRLTALPTAPFQPNTRYVVRVLPGAVGPRYRLRPSPPLRFSTPLFAIDSIDADPRSIEGDEASPIDRIWLGFTHPVRRDDLIRYVSVRRDNAVNADVAFRIDGTAQTCRLCELVLTADAAAVIVEAAPELRPAVGGVALEKTVRRRLASTDRPPFSLLEARPVQSEGRWAVEVLSTRVLTDPVPDGAVLIEPKVGHQVRAKGRRLIVTGDFEPNKEYSVVVVALAARDGTPLDASLETTVAVPALQPDLVIAQEAPVLAPTDVDPIVVNSVAISNLAVKTFRVPIDNLVHVVDQLDQPQRTPWPSLGRWSSPVDIKVSGPMGGTNTTVVRLPNPKATGLRLLEITAADLPWLKERRWIQAGWSLVAKLGVGRTRVQVLSAASRRPIRGVQVRLRTSANLPIGPQLTNASGVAVLDHDVDEAVELVVASKRSETAILDLTETAIRDDRAALHAVGPLDAYVLPAQDRFRTRDPLPVLVVARGAGLEEPEVGQGITVSLRDASGRTWSKVDSKLYRAGSARVNLRWPRRAPHGSYVVEASVKGRSVGRAGVRLQDRQALVGAAALAPSTSTSTGSARLSWTPERPRPGQALQVRWLAPAPGWVTVSLEANDVLAEVRRKVGQGPSTFSLTVPATAVPGAHLVVTFEPTGPGVARTDDVWVDIGRRRPLPVRLTLPPGPHRSGSTIGAQVSVRRAPEKTYVVVQVVAPEAVDAVLRPARNLFEFFHRYRPPAWLTHVETGRFAQAPITRFEEQAPRPASRLTRNASFLSDPIRLRRTGRRKVSLTLPRRQGKLQVRAVVWSGSRFGITTQELEVRDPLALDAAVPAVLTEGDAVEFPVTVYRGPKGPAAVRLLASADEGLSVVETSTQAFELSPGGQSQQTVRVEAMRSGVLTLRAETDGDSATWRRRIDVRPRGPSRIAGARVRADLDQPVPFGWPTDSGRSRVAIGATPVHQLAAAVTRLARAGRDDIETAGARALVRQVLSDLSRPTGPTVSLPRVPGRWTTTLAAVDACLGPDGPRAWPDGPAAAPSSVILAGHAVVRAARRGLVSPRFDDWMEAVRSAARSGAASARTVAYGQWVQALGRRPDDAMLQQLQTEWAGRPPDLASGAGLGAALSLVSRSRQATPFLKFTDVAALEPRDAAFVLAALADGAPDHPVIPELRAQLITALSGGRNEGLRTDALALVGLARLDAQLPARRPFKATLTLGDEVLREITGVSSTVIGDFDDAARTRGDLQLTVTSGAPVFASLVAEGSAPGPDDGPVKVDLQLTNTGGGAVANAQVGDRMVVMVRVGPLSTNVADLRIDVPVPGGVSVTGIEGPDPRARTDRAPGRVSFDLSGSARSVLQFKLLVSATYAGDFALGPVVVSSARQPRQRGASTARRLKIAPKSSDAL